MRSPSTRRELLSGSAAAGVAVSLATSARAATPAAPESEPERLARLLRVELLMLFTYDHVLGSSVLTPRAHRAIEPLRGHEQAHVHALKKRLTLLGTSSPAPPQSVAEADRDLARRSVKGRLGQLRGSADALHLLLALERVVVGAYFVALTKLNDRHLISLVVEIMGVDAQHEAIVGGLLYAGNAQRAVPYGLVQGVQ